RHEVGVDRGRIVGLRRRRLRARERRAERNAEKDDRDPEERGALHRTPHFANRLSRKSPARAMAILSMRALASPGLNGSLKSGWVERARASGTLSVFGARMTIKNPAARASAPTVTPNATRTTVPRGLSATTFIPRRASSTIAR